MAIKVVFLIRKVIELAVKKIELLVPTANPGSRDDSTFERLDTLEGKVLGFLWNSKANGDIVLKRIKEILLQRYNLSGTIWQQKPQASNPAEANVMESLISGCDLVINAQGD